MSLTDSVSHKQEIELLQEKVLSLDVQLMEKNEKNQQLMEEMRGTHCMITVEEPFTVIFPTQFYSLNYQRWKELFLLLKQRKVIYQYWHTCTYYWYDVWMWADITVRLEQSLVESKEEIEIQEKISLLSVQLMDRDERNQLLIEETRGTHCMHNNSRGALYCHLSHSGLQSELSEMKGAVSKPETDTPSQSDYLPLEETSGI